MLINSPGLIEEDGSVAFKTKIHTLDESAKAKKAMAELLSVEKGTWNWISPIGVPKEQESKWLTLAHETYGRWDNRMHQDFAITISPSQVFVSQERQHGLVRKGTPNLGLKVIGEHAGELLKDIKFDIEKLWGFKYFSMEEAMGRAIRKFASEMMKDPEVRGEFGALSGVRRS
jgi:hypothetical protein